MARRKFSRFSTAGPDGPDTDTQKQVARTIRVSCADGGRWPYQNHDPHPVPGPPGDHSAESADIGSRMAATHRRVPRRVLIAVFTLALASATVFMAIRSTHFLYMLYIVVSLLVGIVALSTLVWMLNAWRTPHSLTESQLKADGRETVHSFSLIVPARHEEAVLEHTLSRLISSDHPDFEILVVVGHDDPGTREVAERMANRYPDRIKVIVDPSWPKSKPKALNAALSYCSGMITGVFDAEDDVHPALLRRVDQCFQATDSDIVQAGVQLMNFRSSWYTVHNVLEYYFWFRSRLHVHARQRFIPLGGNTVFIRTPILRTVGGWHDCLAEDCEIGVRLSTLGARTAVFYEPELVTREECPPTLGAFIKQRTRWNQGYLQTLARGYWWRLPLRQRVLGGYILGSPYVLALAWVMIPAAIATAVAVKAPIVITLISFLPLLPMFSMLVAQVVGLGEFCRLYRERRPSVRDYARLVLGLLVYQFILALAAARAVIREARGARGWDKTAHLGLHLDLNTGADAVPSALAEQVPAVIDAHLAQQALAPSVVGSHQLAETESRAPDSRAIVIAARPQGLNGHLDADLATTCQAGNGQASLPVRSVDHLFGENGAEPPVWAWLDEVEDPPTVPVPPVGRASWPPSGDSQGRAGPDPGPSHPDRRPADRRDPPDRADCRRRAGRRNEPAALAGDPVRRGHLHGQRLGTPARPPGQLHLQLRSSAAGLAADLLLDRGRRDPRARHVLHRPRPGVHAPGVPGHVPAAVHPGPPARIRPAGRRQRGPPLRPVSARRLLPPGCTARQPVDGLRDRRLRPRLDAAAAALGVRRQRGLLRVERAVQGDDPRPAAGPVRRGIPERRPPHQALLPRCCSSPRSCSPGVSTRSTRL